MKKTPRLFQDYFMQKAYENLVKEGLPPKKAMKTVVNSFKEYDEGRRTEK